MLYYVEFVYVASTDVFQAFQIQQVYFVCVCVRVCVYMCVCVHFCMTLYLGLFDVEYLMGQKTDKRDSQ